MGLRLSRAARLMQHGLELKLAEQGLTRLKWCVLSGVALEGHSAPSDLADNIGVARPVVSRLLKTMVSEGLVARVLDDDDGRGRWITVTKLGREKVDACWPIVEANQTYFMEKLDATQRRQLDVILTALMADEDKALDSF